MSALGQVMVDTAAAMSKLDAWQTLSRSATEAEALEKIWIGSEAEPAGGDEYTQADREEAFCVAQFEISTEQGHITGEGDGHFGAAAGGNFVISITRTMLPEERETVAKRNEAYVKICGLVGTIIEKLNELIDSADCPIIRAAAMTVPPMWEKISRQSASGWQIFTQYQIAWGDVGNE